MLTPIMDEQDQIERLKAQREQLLNACKELLNCIDPARDWNQAKQARAAIALAEKP